MLEVIDLQLLWPLFCQFVVIVTLWFYKRQERKNAKENGIILYDSSKGELPLEVREYLDQQNGAFDDKEVVKVFVTSTKSL